MTTIYLTDEDSEIEGFLRARLGEHSMAQSLVTTSTPSVTGPTAPIPPFRTVGPVAWITDPLDGSPLISAPGEMHIWAGMSGAASAALEVSLIKWTNSEDPTPFLVERADLATGVNDVNLTPTIPDQTFAKGDRIVIRAEFNDATGAPMIEGYILTLTWNGRRPRANGDSWIAVNDDLGPSAGPLAADRARVRGYLQDTASTPSIKDDQIDQAIEDATRTYSRTRPRTAFTTLAGPGSRYRLPADWIIGFSELVEIIPSVNVNPPESLQPNRWWIEEHAETTAVVFLNEVATGESAASRYTTYHTRNTEQSTIPPGDVEAVLCLATSYAALMEAAKMASIPDQVQAAGAGNFSSGTVRWMAVAKAYAERYANLMGLNIGGAEGAGALLKAEGATVITNWDRLNSFRMDPLFHPRRFR
jgi:hypothetical protein